MSDDLHLKIFCELCGRMLGYHIIARGELGKQWVRVEIDPTTCDCMEALKTELQEYKGEG